MDAEGPQRRDYYEIGEDESPPAGPGAPKAAAQIGDENADLDR